MIPETGSISSLRRLQSILKSRTPTFVEDKEEHGGDCR
jgi:hypothetical protein